MHGRGFEGKICWCGLIMQENKTLTNLNLRQNNIGDEGGKCMAEALKVRFAGAV